MTSWQRNRRLLIALLGAELSLVVLIAAGIVVGHLREPSTATPPSATAVTPTAVLVLPSQSVPPSAAASIPPRTSRVAWPSTTASASDVLARFRAAGLNVEVQPTGRGLLFGADSDEQFLLQGETAAIYTLPTAAASARVLDDAANNRLTVSYLRTPYYVQVANLLVVIATNDPKAAAIAIDTLTRP